MPNEIISSLKGHGDMNDKPNRHAALLIFDEGTTEEEIKAALKKLAEIASVRLEEYNDRYSGPTLYYP